MWLLAFAPSLLAATQLTGRLKGGGYGHPGTPSYQTFQVMRDRLRAPNSRVIIVFTSDTLDARSLRFEELEQQALAPITSQDVPGLVTVDTFASTGLTDLVSTDGHASLAVLGFSTELEGTQLQIPTVRGLLRPTALHAYLTGEAAVFQDLQRLSARDLERAEAYALPVSLVVLLLVFGTLVAAGLPVLGGGIAVTVTFGVVYLVTGLTDMSIFVMNSATMLGLAVGIDYALFMVGRFREELGGGHAVPAAVENTVARAGRSIFFSGMAVIVGLCGLLTFPSMALRSVGAGGIIVVAVSVLGALTLLPALLSLLGTRVDSLRVFGRHRVAAGEGRFWWAWSEWVMRRPWPVLVVTVLFMVVLALPAIRLQIDVPNARMLPTSAEARAGYDIIQSSFDASVIAPIDVVLTWDGLAPPAGEAKASPLPAASPSATGFEAMTADPMDAGNLRRELAFGQELAKLPGVAKVQSVANIAGFTDVREVLLFWDRIRTPGSQVLYGPGMWMQTLGPPTKAQTRSVESVLSLLTPLGRQNLLRMRRTSTAPSTIAYTVYTQPDPTSRAGREVVARILALTPPAGTRLYAGGLTSGVRDYLHDVKSHFLPTVAFVVVATYLVLLLMLRSVVLPLKAVVVNLLSLAAAYGALVAVFQWGWFDWLLRFEATGSIAGDLPLIIFCGVFGISMDYEVFLLTRMREEWLTSGDPRRAVTFGLARTGRIVTSAALIIVVVAGTFAFTDIVYTKALGVGLAVAVGLDATVVRVLMVPAIMRILGRWNWWLPRRLDRLLPHVGE